MKNKVLLGIRLGLAWYTRFSAGNYNSDNSAGYVRLPNGGFVSYGD